MLPIPNKSPQETKPAIMSFCEATAPTHEGCVLDLYIIFLSSLEYLQEGRSSGWAGALPEEAKQVLPEFSPWKGNQKDASGPPVGTVGGGAKSGMWRSQLETGNNLRTNQG